MVKQSVSFYLVATPVEPAKPTEQKSFTEPKLVSTPPHHNLEKFERKLAMLHNQPKILSMAVQPHANAPPPHGRREVMWRKQVAVSSVINLVTGHHTVWIILARVGK